MFARVYGWPPDVVLRQRWCDVFVLLDELDERARQGDGFDGGVM